MRQWRSGGRQDARVGSKEKEDWQAASEHKQSTLKMPSWRDNRATSPEQRGGSVAPRSEPASERANLRKAKMDAQREVPESAQSAELL